MSDRFDELVGDIADPAERERLRRVHQLLLSVDAPPELPAPAEAPAPVVVLERRRRPYAVALIAAALAAAAFGAGWLGGARSDDVAVERVIPMAGVNDGRGASGADGSGLAGMRERVTALGGHVSRHTDPSGGDRPGTVVAISLPRTTTPDVAPRPAARP